MVKGNTCLLEGGTALHCRSRREDVSSGRADRELKPHATDSSSTQELWLILLIVNEASPRQAGKKE